MKTIKYLIPAVIAAMSITDAGATEGKMKGVDKSNFDETISPKDDFFQFACGGWMKANPLPAQYSRFGTFDILAENNKTQVKELIQNLANTSEAKEAGSIAQKVNDMYQLGMDSVRLNAEKASPLKADLEKITTAKRADFINIISWLHMGIGAPFFDTAPLSEFDFSFLYYPLIFYLSHGRSDPCCCTGRFFHPLASVQHLLYNFCIRICTVF